MSITKQNFLHKNVSYSYWIKGNPKNPTMVIVPGFTGTHGDVVDFAREFENDHFLIIPDLPGWGDSPRGSYHPTIDGYTQFLHDLLHSQGVREKIILVGHCMGSLIVFDYGLKFPERVKEIFAVSVPYLGDTVSQKMFEHLATASRKVPPLLRPFFFFFRSRLFAVPMGFFVIQTRSLRKKLHIIIKNTVKQQFQDEGLVEKNWNSLVLFDYSKIANLSMPVHLFHGEKDMLVLPQYEEKIKEVTHGTLDIIPDSGHMPPVETPGALATAMRKYL